MTDFFRHSPLASAPLALQVAVASLVDSKPTRAKIPVTKPGVRVIQAEQILNMLRNRKM